MILFWLVFINSKITKRIATNVKSGMDFHLNVNVPLLKIVKETPLKNPKKNITNS
jgi:hypothetical protein